MGTCIIVEWCDNPKCLDGCLAQKAIEKEREACIVALAPIKAIADEQDYAGQSEAVQECIWAIQERSNKDS